MRKLALAALAALSLAGCAKGVYEKAGATPAMRTADYRQCEYEAALATEHIGEPLERGYRRGEMLHRCMLARGWS